MKKRLVFGGGVALVIAVAVLVNCRTVRAPSAPAAPVASTPSPSPASEPAQPVDAAAPVQAPAPAAAVSPAPQPAPTGAERLAERRNLTRPATTPALEAMKQFDRDEMLLLAQVQKRTNRTPPPAVKEIVEARRSGSSFDELWALADQKLAGDAEMLLAVRGWLNEVVRPAVEGGTAIGEDAPKGTPLELGGTVTPVK